LPPELKVPLLPRRLLLYGLLLLLLMLLLLVLLRGLLGCSANFALMYSCFVLSPPSRPLAPMTPLDAATLKAG
jgi:hypothetical protein